MKTPVKLSSKASQYYVIAERWGSDLDFFKVEDNFYHHLLDKYVNSSSSTEHLEKLKKLGRELKILEEERLKVEILVGELLNRIALMADDKVPENLKEVETSHTTIELLMIDLIKKYRRFKRDLFNTVENIK